MENIKTINIIATLVAVFNLVIYYGFSVKTVSQSFVYTFIFFVVVYLISKFLRGTLQKEPMYILHKQVEKEFGIFFGIFIIISGLIKLNLDLERGYWVSLIYLVVSIFNSFIEKYIYDSEKVRKMLNRTAFVLFFVLAPLLLLGFGWYGVKYNLDIADQIKAVILVVVGLAVVYFTIYNPKKILNI